jgi:hypothetical protein
MLSVLVMRSKSFLGVKAGLAELSEVFESLSSGILMMARGKINADHLLCSEGGFPYTAFDVFEGKEGSRLRRGWWTWLRIKDPLLLIHLLYALRSRTIIRWSTATTTTTTATITDI